MSDKAPRKILKRLPAPSAQEGQAARKTTPKSSRAARIPDHSPKPPKASSGGGRRGSPAATGSQASPWAAKPVQDEGGVKPVREARQPAQDAKPAWENRKPSREAQVIRETRKPPLVKPVMLGNSRPAGEAPIGVRVSKLLAEQGLCSRREADAYIQRGWVFVDGVRVTELGTRALPGAQVTLAAEAKKNQSRQVTILLNKPVGFVSGQPEPGYEPAVVLIRRENQWLEAGEAEFDPRHLKGLAPAGRLDIDSTGLLVLTQDGRIARQLIGEDSGVEKEYLVRVEGQLSEDGLVLLNHGLALDGKALKPAKVSWQNADQLRFILREGKKRQIRRMCELVGLTVVGLKRVRMGQVRLEDLPAGKWRYLRDGEGF